LLKLPLGEALGSVMVPGVTMLPVAVVGPPESGDIAMSILADVGLAGVLQAAQPARELFAITKRFTGMLNVTAVFGGKRTVLGLAFAMTIDLRQLFVVTTQTDPLLPAQAKLDCGAGAKNNPKRISANGRTARSRPRVTAKMTLFIK
jgi:hypothetical protein